MRVEPQIQPAVCSAKGSRETDVSQNSVHELLETQAGRHAPRERRGARLRRARRARGARARARPRRRGDRGGHARARDASGSRSAPPAEEAERPIVAEAAVATGAGDSLQLFLADVGRHKLLTAAEEVTLAKRIEKGDLRRQAAHDRVEPPPRRLDRQGLPRPRRPVPRPDPGGHARPQPRRREVRLAPRLQVLDLRDLVDPPVGAARRREQRAHDPRPRARRRAAAEARPRRPPARGRARPRGDEARSWPRRPGCRSSTSTRRSRPRRRPSR